MARNLSKSEVRVIFVFMCAQISTCRIFIVYDYNENGTASEYPSSEIDGGYMT